MNEITKKLMMSLMTLMLVFAMPACDSDSDKDEPEEDYAKKYCRHIHRTTDNGRLCNRGCICRNHIQNIK